MTQDPRSVAGCILFLRSQGAPADPAALRAVAEAAAAAWQRKRCVVLQGPEGFAIAGAVSPSVALHAARRAAAHPKAPQVSIALHHGALRVQGTGADARVAGEGVGVAAVLSGLAGARTLVSGAFRAALAEEAPRLARDLQPITDLTGPGGAALFRDDPKQARARGQRRTLLAATGMLALLGAGWGAREARVRYEAAHRPAVVLLDIQPSGEVFVDGASQGLSPPLTRLALAPGPHTIEVRRPRAKPLRLQVQLKPGQELPVQHVFPAPPPRRPAPPRSKPKPEPGALERFKFW